MSTGVAAVTMTMTVCVLAMGAVCSPMDKHQRELKDHYEHLAHIAEFKCAEPQRRAVSIHKLLPKPETRGKAFFPDVTVLGRCDCGSGTCLAGHQCAPAHHDTLRLPVKVTFLHDTEGHKKGSWQIEYYEFHNHTACTCVQLTPDEEAEHCDRHHDHDHDHEPSPTTDLGQGQGQGLQTVRVVHEHYIVPSSEVDQYQEVLASLPAIEHSYQHVSEDPHGQTSQQWPQESAAEAAGGPTRLCIPPSCK